MDLVSRNTARAKNRARVWVVCVRRWDLIRRLGLMENSLDFERVVPIQPVEKIYQLRGGVIFITIIHSGALGDVPAPAMMEDGRHAGGRCVDTDDFFGPQNNREEPMLLCSEDHILVPKKNTPGLRPVRLCTGVC